ncbi:MAG: metallophosphoesterase family protein [Candidatus Odinarchaeota archaeon]
MLVAILADVHSNLPALEVVVEYCHDHQVEVFFVIGDLVGYYTKPTEVVALLQHQHTHTVMGNHDMSVVGGVFAEKFSPDFLGALTETFIAAQNLDALEAIAWSITRIHPSVAESLLEETYKRMTVEGVNLGLCHGMPQSIRGNLTDEVGGYLYTKVIEKHAPALVEFCVREQIDFLLSGHTHYFHHVQLKHGSKVINLLNPGSVGQPRDGDPRTSFAVLDLEEGQCRNVENIRLEYNVELTKQGIYREKLPEALAKRLDHGV